MGRSDLSRHALEQAKRGERVHPLHDGDKTPGLRGWQSQAATNQEVIGEWWSKWPDSNVGIVVARGEAFVDIDTPQAEVEFQKRVSVAGTPMVHTPSGGWHVLYRGELPNRVLIHNGGRPLEVKGPGSNRVAPGSVTAEGEYRLLLDASKPPAPDELIRWIEDTRAGRKRDARVGRGDLIGRAIFKGERNMVMFKLAAFMRRAGINSEGIEAALLVHNRSSCHPPLAGAK
jgi:Bifunctional DNA primase/polymerase, N-terminal/Primase C terminal 1 (PriCT-1)